MSKQRLMIWGREFEMELRYYNYDNEEVTELQEQTAAQISSVDFDEARKKLDQYIIDNDYEGLEREDIDNIFKYVVPQYILIFRTSENREFALMCDYKFDQEHGLAILFRNEQLVSVTSQDYVL